MEKKEPSKMAQTIGFLATSASLLYHIAIFFVFLILRVYPMFFYNIISISIFSILLFLIPHRKSLVVLFTIATTEVVVHQILAEYFIGSEANFHFFIFVVGLLPYLVFDYHFKASIPMTTITTMIFVALENFSFPGVYEIPITTIRILKYINVSIAIIMIVMAILLFTMLVSRSEKKITSQNNMLEGEIKRASVIQSAFFKQNVKGLKGWDVSYFIKPMAGVSGDFFDFCRTGNQLDGLGIFDVSGHGISSGLITMLVKNIIHQEFYNNQNMELWEILNKINDRIVEEKGDVENYLTGILTRFTPTQAEMVIAGHPTPIIYKKNTGKCDYLKKTTESSGAIGIAGFPTFYISQYVDFEDGDRLFYFSDGVTDASNEKKEAFGRERLLQAFRESIYLDADSQINYIRSSISEFRGNAVQNDDITMICIVRGNK
ncbi:MAG: serine/threonine-protein phosphatase [Treponema sp.]|nr:serine/threonine-protein phosphatase [Treponema sp.]